MPIVFFILNIYFTQLLFQFLHSAIRILIPILLMVQKGRIIIEKFSYFAKKITFNA